MLDRARSAVFEARGWWDRNEKTVLRGERIIEIVERVIFFFLRARSERSCSDDLGWFIFFFIRPGSRGGWSFLRVRRFLVLRSPPFFSSRRIENVRACSGNVASTFCRVCRSFIYYFIYLPFFRLAFLLLFHFFFRFCLRPVALDGLAQLHLERITSSDPRCGREKGLEHEQVRDSGSRRKRWKSTVKFVIELLPVWGGNTRTRSILPRAFLLLWISHSEWNIPRTRHAFSRSF